MLSGQEDAKCPITKEELLAKLNNEITFFKDNPKYKSKGSVEVMVNCEGEVVKVEVDFKKMNKILENQIIDLIKRLGNWEPGKLEGKKVDSITLFSFKVKKGKVAYD
jgi:hypothetical protein